MQRNTKLLLPIFVCTLMCIHVVHAGNIVMSGMKEKRAAAATQSLWDIVMHLRKDEKLPMHLVEDAQRALDAGADSNARLHAHRYGFTMLGELSRVRSSFEHRQVATEIVRLLVERGADVAAVSYHDWLAESTPLLLAAGYGHIGMARIFLEHGADVNARHPYAGTPLSGAIYYSSCGMVKLLLEYGAVIDDADVRTAKWYPAINLAVISAQLEMKRLKEFNADWIRLARQ